MCYQIVQCPFPDLPPTLKKRERRLQTVAVCWSKNLLICVSSKHEKEDIAFHVEHSHGILGVVSASWNTHIPHDTQWLQSEWSMRALTLSFCFPFLVAYDFFIFLYCFLMSFQQILPGSLSFSHWECLLKPYVAHLWSSTQILPSTGFPPGLAKLLLGARGPESFRQKSLSSFQELLHYQNELGNIMLRYKNFFVVALTKITNVW